jgi:hypothetical protein
MAIANDELRRLIETHPRMGFSLALRVSGDYASAAKGIQARLEDLLRTLI